MYLLTRSMVTYQHPNYILWRVNVYSSCHHVVSSTVLLYPPYYVEMGSWDNVCAIVSGLGAGKPRNLGSIRTWHGQVFSPKRPDRFWDQAGLIPIPWVPGIKVACPWSCQPPPSVVQAKNDYTFTSTPIHIQRHLYRTAVSWFRRLVANLLLRMPGFDPRTVECVEHKVALGRGFLWALSVSLVIILPPMFIARLSCICRWHPCLSNWQRR
jgi:hypothetical protein